MRRWKNKVRGALSLGAIGGGVGALLGGVGMVIAGVVNGVVLPSLVALSAGLWGTFGVFCAMTFSLLLATRRPKTPLHELSMPKVGLFGLAGGAVFPLILNSFVTGSLAPFFMAVEMAPVLAVCGVLGGSLSTGMVAIAKLPLDHLEPKNHGSVVGGPQSHVRSAS